MTGLRIAQGRALVCLISGWALRSRVVWVQVHGPIPAGHLIHHVDGNLLNDELSNLACVTPSEHGYLHPRPHRPHRRKNFELECANL